MIMRPFKTYAASPAPPTPGRLTVAAVKDPNVLHNAEQIAALEKQLGLPASAFDSRLAMSRARLQVLREMTGQPSVAAPVVIAPVAAAQAAIAAAAQTIAAAPEAGGMLKATLAEFYKMDSATRAEFAADGGALAKSDFDKLTLSAKSKFCVAGGKILDDTPANPRNLSTAARSFGNS